MEWLIDKHTAGRKVSHYRAIRDNIKDEIKVSITIDFVEYLGILKPQNEGLK